MLDSENINETAVGGNKKRKAILKDFAALYNDGWRPLKFEALRSKSPNPIGVMFLRRVKRPGSVFMCVIHERDERWIYGRPVFAGSL